MIKKEELVLTSEWDKTFPKSEKVQKDPVTANPMRIPFKFSI